MDNAMTTLNNIGIELVADNELDLSLRVFEFPFKIPVKMDEVTRLLFLINQAMTHKWMGQVKKCNDILEKTDWSVLADKFQFGHAVLYDNFDDAADIMRRIGAGDKKSHIQQHDYHGWPILREFRKSEQFATAYRDVFGEDYQEISTALANSVDAEEDEDT